MAYNRYPGSHPSVDATKKKNKEIINIDVYGTDGFDGDESRTYSIVEHIGDNFTFFVERDLPYIEDLEEGVYDSIDDVADNDVYKSRIYQNKVSTNHFIHDNQDVRFDGGTNTYATDEAAHAYLKGLHDSKLDFMRDNNLSSNSELAPLLRSTELSKLLNTSTSISSEQESKHIEKLLDGFDEYINLDVNSIDRNDKTGTKLLALLDKNVQRSGIESNAAVFINKENLIEQLFASILPIKNDTHMQKALFNILNGDIVQGYVSPKDSPLYFDSAIKSISTMC